MFPFTKSRARQHGLLATIIAGAAGASMAQAEVIHVPADQPTIQAGINAAQNGDEVVVADGTYTGTGNHTLSLQGKAITLRSANGPASCIIDAQATSTNQRSVFRLISGETTASVIDGFTVRGGYAFNGAGFFLSNSSPTIANCIITQNSADCWGSGLYYDNGSSPLIRDCRFLDNYVDDDGGAIFGIHGSPLVTNCAMIGNVSGVTGGAVTVFGSGGLVLEHCTIAGNTAHWGSAIYGSAVTVRDSIIWGNTGSPDPILSWSDNIVVTHSLVQGGYAGVGNLNIDPDFADLANGDVHLRPGSPAIDAGNPACEVPAGAVDIDGDPRMFGDCVDMGVDEYRRPGDITGDHAVNVFDLLELLGTWGDAPGHPADLTGDGTVNVFDLLDLLANWGTSS